MAENSAIEWTDHTFNPWVGCTKVSAGCANCYAERDFDHRRGFARWGKGQQRRMTGASTWAQPKRWDRRAYENRAAWLAGVRPRVFCASLADVFDAEVPDEWRDQLFMLIDECANLTWLLLTKRPAEAGRYMDRIRGMSRTQHVWVGTSVEDQAAADERIPLLLQIPAAKRFLSCEPLLGPVDLDLYDIGHRDADGRLIDWVIAGGESGPQARPMHPDWARSLRDQCQDAGVPFFFKQWGEWGPSFHKQVRDAKERWVCRTDGQVVTYWDDSLYGWQRNEYHCMARMGKKRAGRLLDGRTWDEVPTTAQQETQP